MTATTLLVAVVILPLLGTMVTFFARNAFVGRAAPSLALAFQTVLLVAALGLLRKVDLYGTVVLASGDWAAPVGITLVADRLGAIMVAISAFIAWAVSLYEVGEARAGRMQPLRTCLMQAMLLGVHGAFLTGDLFNLYVWFEVMLMASFALMALNRTRAGLGGALPYLLLNLLGSALFLIGAGLVYGKVGTLNMADLAARLAAEPAAFLVDSSGMLLFVAFALKAAVFPFFFWLPDSYPQPPIPVIALFAGLLTKVGIYTLLRSYTLFFATGFEPLQEILLVLAALTMITGVLGAAQHFEIKRILSFHIISQIGYMLLGLGLMTSLGIASVVFYIVHHIVVKANLFLLGGIIEQRTGSTDLKKVGGLYAAVPWLALLFVVPAFSLGGIPPLSGFWAKLGLVQAMIEEAQWGMLAVALGVGLLTLFSMTKIWAEAFWKKSPTEAETLRPGSRWAYAATAVLSCTTLYFGFAGGAFFDLAERTAADLLTPAQYVQAVLGELAPPLELALNDR
jgi:multicomponent Na+:H+ antiporter subunit D